MSNFQGWDSRADFLDWVRDRSEEYLTKGEIYEAWISFKDDLEKHPETKNHPGLILGSVKWCCGQLNTVDKMREFLRSFR